MHPFLSLLAGSFTMAVCAGVEYNEAFGSFTSGVGSTIANVGLLIAFGSIIGTILFKSGGADTIVDTIMAKTPLQRLPWAMALIAFIVGIPMFFEVGVVILIPVVLFAARRAKAPVVLLGIPALAGLSTLHAFVPPRPGPLTAIGALNANLGITLALGLLVAIPTVIISGPIFSKLAARTDLPSICCLSPSLLHCGRRQRWTGGTNPNQIHNSTSNTTVERRTSCSWQ